MFSHYHLFRWLIYAMFNGDGHSLFINSSMDKDAGFFPLGYEWTHLHLPTSDYEFKNISSDSVWGSSGSAYQRRMPVVSMNLICYKRLRRNQIMPNAHSHGPWTRWNYKCFQKVHVNSIYFTWFPALQPFLIGGEEQKKHPKIQHPPPKSIATSCRTLLVPSPGRGSNIAWASGIWWDSGWGDTPVKARLSLKASKSLYSCAMLWVRILVHLLYKQCWTFQRSDVTWCDDKVLLAEIPPIYCERFHDATSFKKHGPWDCFTLEFKLSWAIDTLAMLTNSKNIYTLFGWGASLTHTSHTHYVSKPDFC